MYFERVIKVARIYLENWTMRKSSERREGHLPDRLILSLRNNLLILRAHFSSFHGNAVPANLGIIRLHLSRGTGSILLENVWDWLLLDFEFEFLKLAKFEE